MPNEVSRFSGPRVDIRPFRHPLGGYFEAAFNPVALAFTGQPPPLVGGALANRLNLPLADVVAAFDSGKLPGRPTDKIAHRPESWPPVAVQVTMDSPKILSVAALVFESALALEAWTRAGVATANWFAERLPQSWESEDMLRPNAVESLYLLIPEFYTRPDHDSQVWPHLHSHLLIHPHLRNVGRAQSWIWCQLRELELLGGAVWHRNLANHLAAVGLNIADPQWRAYARAYSARLSDVRGPKLRQGLAHWQGVWRDIAEQRGLMPPKLGLKGDWPRPVGTEETLKIAEGLGWLPFDRAEMHRLNSLRTRLRRLRPYGAGKVQITRVHDAASVSVETVEGQIGSAVIVSVGGPLRGPRMRWVEADLERIMFSDWAAGLVAAHRRLNHPRPIILKVSEAAECRTEDTQAANEAIREVLLAEKMLGPVVGKLKVVDPASIVIGDAPGVCLQNYVGGGARAAQNRRGWTRGVTKEILEVDGNGIRTVDGWVHDLSRIELFLWKTCEVREGECMRCLRGSGAGRKQEVHKGQVVPVASAAGNEIVSFGGLRIDGSWFDYAYAIPTKEPGRLPRLVRNPVKEAVGKHLAAGPRIPSAIDWDRIHRELGLTFAGNLATPPSGPGGTMTEILAGTMLAAATVDADLVDAVIEFTAATMGLPRQPSVTDVTVRLFVQKQDHVRLKRHLSMRPRSDDFRRTSPRLSQQAQVAPAVCSITINR